MTTGLKGLISTRGIYMNQTEVLYPQGKVRRGSREITDMSTQFEATLSGYRMQRNMWTS